MMKNSRKGRLIWLIAALAIGIAAPGASALAQTDKAAGETAAAPKKAKRKRDPGQKLYMRRTCIACHGRGGAAAIQDYPNIAGQSEKYIIRQVNDILDGKRVGSADATGNPRTQGMRGALVTSDGKRRITKDEVKKIAAWLAKQKPAAVTVPEPPIDAERLKQGASDYKKGKCKTCHGADGRKPKSKTYPVIAGQKSAYIIAQMKDIRDGKRKNAQSKLMKPFVKKLDDETIARIADFLSQVDRSKD